MKKITMTAILCGMLLMCSCGENKPENTESSGSSESIHYIETSETVTETEKVQTVASTEVTGTQIQSVTETVTVSDTKPESTSESSAVTETLQTETTTTVQTETQVMETFTEPSEEPFEIDESGSVKVEIEENADDSEYISLAQKLFEKACETEFSYHVGCPYNLDYTNHIENQYGWPYYLITDEGYTSVADIENDYYKVFAEERGNDLSEIYMEQDGRVYALDGARGANIFYESSEVTGIIEKTDNKIIFSVDNHYTGDDKDPETPITRTEQFAIIIKDDEARVSEFHLPY